jgi:hypothetical protein
MRTWARHRKEGRDLVADRNRESVSGDQHRRRGRGEGIWQQSSVQPLTPPSTQADANNEPCLNHPVRLARTVRMVDRPARGGRSRVRSSHLRKTESYQGKTEKAGPRKPGRESRTRIAGNRMPGSFPRTCRWSGGRCGRISAWNGSGDTHEHVRRCSILRFPG